MNCDVPYAIAVVSCIVDPCRLLGPEGPVLLSFDF